jgi:hypothetical protein
MLGEETVLFGVLAGPRRVPRNRLESFGPFAGNEKFHLRRVPDQLTDDLRQVRVAKYCELLHALETMQRAYFRHTTTGDES